MWRNPFFRFSFTWCFNFWIDVDAMRGKGKGVEDKFVSCFFFFLCVVGWFVKSL